MTTDSAASTRHRGQRPFGIAVYTFLWIVCRAIAVSVFGFRVRFAQPMPLQGGLLVLSTHQSHLDPLLLGLASPRRLSSLARKSLYDWKLFAAIISILDAIPIDRDASAIAGLRAIIGRLQHGVGVVIFPEGTRSRDGSLGEIKAGFVIAARKSGVPIMPVAIVGAWECWERSWKFPRPGRIRLEFGQMITPQEVAQMTDAELVASCRARLESLDAMARQLLQRSLM